jgi:hypothetical protein
MERLFSTWSVQGCYTQGTNSLINSVVSSVRESVKRELWPGGRGIATVGAFTRKRLVTD